MNRAFVTGDCHKQFMRLEYFCKKENTTLDDVLIILGDSGINYFLDERDEWDKKFLSKLPITIIIIHGNHEERAWKCDGYIEKEINRDNIKGLFYMEEKYPNLLFCHDIDTFSINDKKFLVLSGAYSVDKPYRLEMGYHWFESEQIAKQDMNLFLSSLHEHIQNNNSEMYFDYVLSHTCPFKYMPTDLFLSGIDQSKVDSNTEYFLNEVDHLINYKEWFFGHFHDDRQAWDNGTMLFGCVHKLDI